jgi:molybdopterin/thiamine biosynthesis adenylyltransferase
MIDLICKINGTCVNQLVYENPDLKSDIENIIPALVDWNIVEYTAVADWISSQSNYRTLNFLSDYIPTYALLGTYKRLRDSRVIIFGCGGVGSLVADGLASIGVRDLVLCDPDEVKAHNLNRGIFTRKDLDVRKVDALGNRFEDLYPEVRVVKVPELFETEAAVTELLAGWKNIDLVINSADFPNVDTTSKLIFPPCMNLRIPHIVSGGYNLHLSLIGPTIIPFETPCFKCIEVGLERLQTEDFSHLRKLKRPKRNIGNLAPLANIAASYTVNEALKTLLRGKYIYPTMVGKRGEFNYLTGKANYTTFNKVTDCAWCSASDQV